MRLMRICILFPIYDTDTLRFVALNVYMEIDAPEESERLRVRECADTCQIY